MNIIDEIRNLKDDEVEAWINKRLSAIEKLEGTTIGLMRHHTSTDKFIASNVNLYNDNLGGCFILDDDSIYHDVVNLIRKSNTSKNGFDVAAFFTCYYVLQYFGWGASNKKCEDILMRAWDAMESLDDDIELTSIREFKGENAAVCLERAAMAHNILKFLGFDTKLQLGFLPNGEAHAYIVFNDHTYDFMLLNYKPNENEKGKIICYPTIDGHIRQITLDGRTFNTDITYTPAKNKFY